jgi:hypothetical protein
MPDSSGPDVSALIASIFWEEIRADVEAAGICTNLYRAYPFIEDELYELN